MWVWLKFTQRVDNYINIRVVESTKFQGNKIAGAFSNILFQRKILNALV